VGKNLSQLSSWQGINNQNIQEAQKTKAPQNQQPKLKIGKGIKQNFYKGRSPET
jgi:hypothetical protein